jgi:hypothetical protein
VLPTEGLFARLARRARSVAGAARHCGGSDQHEDGERGATGGQRVQLT